MEQPLIAKHYYIQLYSIIILINLLSLDTSSVGSSPHSVLSDSNRRLPHRGKRPPGFNMPGASPHPKDDEDNSLCEDFEEDDYDLVKQVDEQFKKEIVEDVFKTAMKQPLFR